jgi:hypothetical protein
MSLRHSHIPLPPLRTTTEKELRKRIPPLQTDPPSAPAPANPANPAVTSPASPSRRQRFVLTDTIASRYLEEDPNATVLARSQPIEGYEIYLVEQWACSRAHPTFLITTYTGNPDDTVKASVLSVPADKAEWSPQMRLYFDSLAEYHARPKDTAYGTLMITNLSGFPSSLTVIPIPGGDLRKYRELFFVNENLKRLGCSGRLGIKLDTPSSATQAKFHQLYRTSEKIPLNSAVIELVKLCQVALVLFGKLEPEYADGLLCDVTEKAINDWWIEFGAEYYTVEPHDGILGPTTVSALLGMLMGARNRLSALNSPVAKDVFDVESTKRGIAHFQKSQRLQRNRRLDRQTLDKLRRATAKAASKEGWGMPRAFKSTVAELGGKGGEMMMGMVGAGEKEGIAEIETVDIDRFVELVRGDHAKWLWHGKPRKTASGDMFNRLPGEEDVLSPSASDHSRNPLKRQTTLDEHRLPKRDTAKDDDVMSEPFSPDGPDREKDPFSRRAAIKAKLESGSGFHRIKDAVGLRSHSSKLSKDEHVRADHERSKLSAKSPQLPQGESNGLSSVLSLHRNSTDIDRSITKVLTETPEESTLELNKTRSDYENGSHPLALQQTVADSGASTRSPTVENSIAGSIYRGVELNRRLPLEEAHEIPPLLRRTQSVDQHELEHAPRSDAWWPRHLSFSIAEESVLKWGSIASADLNEEAIEETDTSTSALVARQAAYTVQSEQLKRLHSRLAHLAATDTAWVEARLTEIEELDAMADTDIKTLDEIYQPRLDTYNALRESTHAEITNSRAQLTAALRDLDNVSDKLEYEIGALRGKVDDVDEILDEFEKQVESVEQGAQELEHVLGHQESWWHWGLRIMTGIGRKPE